MPMPARCDSLNAGPHASPCPLSLPGARRAARCEQGPRAEAGPPYGWFPASVSLSAFVSLEMFFISVPCPSKLREGFTPTTGVFNQLSVSVTARRLERQACIEPNGSKRACRSPPAPWQGLPAAVCLASCPQQAPSSHPLAGGRGLSRLRRWASEAGIHRPRGDLFAGCRSPVFQPVILWD